MNGEYITDNWLDWQYKDDYKLGPDGIWYPVDDNTENESEVNDVQIN